MSMELANGLINKFFTCDNIIENKYHVDDLNMASYNNYIYVLSNEILENSIVLDVGCAQGKLGKKLSEKNCTLYGIEINEFAVKEAMQSGFYKNVFLYDIENGSVNDFKKIEEIINRSLDYIIFSDILEHLVNPTKVLMNFTKLLSTKGEILIGVPNISNSDIVLHLLNDEFNYTDLGIMDNTHLKFFTKKSFAQWIQQINNTYNDYKFDCIYLGKSFFISDYMGEVEYKYSELFEILINSENYNALQIFFKLKLINKNEEAQELNSIINQGSINVVELLGNILKGKNIENQNLSISNNERLWMNEKNKDKMARLADALDYIKTLEEENGRKYNQINEALKYIEQLENVNGLKQSQIKEALMYIEQLENENVLKQSQINEAFKNLEILEIENDKNTNQINEALNYIKLLENDLGNIQTLNDDSWNKQNQIDEALCYIKDLEQQAISLNERFIQQLDELNEKNCTQIKEVLKYSETLKDDNWNKQNQIDEALFYIKDLEQQAISLNKKYILQLDEMNKKNSIQIKEALEYSDTLKNDNWNKQNQIDEALSYIYDLEQQVLSLKKDTHTLTSEKDNLQIENEVINAKCDDLELKLSSLYEKIFKMENSLSWKLTKPLRKTK